MKRSIVVVIMVIGLLAGGGAWAGARPAPADPPPPVRPVGQGGKIIAVKPPGAWDRPAGPVDTRAPFRLLAPAILPVFGVDVNIMGSNETAIASDPTRPLYFIAGANGGAGSNRGTSTDGGLTWTTGSFSGIGDPVVAYDDLGNGYFAQLSTGTCPDPAVVYRSANGGLTWGAAVVALSDPQPGSHFIDKEWMVADNWPASPFHHRLYVTASSFNAPNCNLGAYIDDREVLAYSTDQGATWSPSITLSDASHDQDQFTNPVVAPDGTLIVGYQYQNCTYNCTSAIPMVQLIAKSTDGGVTFSPSITITGQPIIPTGAFVGGYQYLYAGSTGSGFRHNDQAIIGVSPTNPNQIYALWTDGRWDTSFVYQSITGQHADIAFSRSTDGGATWSAPLKVDDLANGDGTDQYFPWMVVGSDGTLHASWMDRRAGGFPYREYYSQSTDGGLTWAANIPVADVGNTPGTFIGDYSGLAVNAANSIVLPIWTDQRSGQRAYTDRGAIPAQGTPTVTPTAPAVTSTPTVTPPAATATGGIPTATNTPGAGASPTPTITLCPFPFTDVDPFNPYYVYIRCLYCRGIVSGYNDNTFRPYNNVTRGQVAKIVGNAAGFVDVIPSAQQTFTDVPPSQPFWVYIERHAQHGTISGYTCGGVGEPCDPQNRPYFRPAAAVTRGQLAKIDANAAGYIDNPGTAQSFADVPLTDPFWVYIQRLALRGIIAGYQCGTSYVNPCTGLLETCDSQQRPYYRPCQDITRGQTSKIVANTFFPVSCAPGPARPSK